MEYQPLAPTHVDIFENFIDTQQATGHYSEGGPLPAYLLTQKFEETPGTFDPHAFYDYSRREIADFRPDPPLFANDEPRDTRKYSKTRMNVLHFGSRSGADPAHHPEMFYGFLDEDDRTPGDDHFPAWKMAAQMAARAHYLKPHEPKGATHLTEAEPEGIETETRRYEKLQEARSRVRRNLHMFSRTIDNTRPRGGRTQEQMTGACLPQARQSAEGGAGSGGARADTMMRSQRRAEYTPGDEKHSRQASTRVMPSADAAALAAARACAMADGGGAAELVESESRASEGIPSRVDASAGAARTARMMRHRGRGASEPVAESAGVMQDQRGGPDLLLLARGMADCGRRTEGDMASDDSPGPGVVAPRAWHLDDGDPLALLHRATGHEAERQQEILEIATQIASRTTVGPASMPHLAIDARGRMSRGAQWSGGPERAMIDDAPPSYLMVDAILMKRACERPRETDLIRRKMLTDARQPTIAELELANRGAAIGFMNRYKGAVIASTKTYRDIEMASDAMQVENARLMSMGEAPTSWHSATSALTEAQLTAEPEHFNVPGTSAAREGSARSQEAFRRIRPVAANVMRAAMTATRDEAMDHDHESRRRGADRRGDVSDRVAPPRDIVRSVGGARLGRQGASRKSLVFRESMVDDALVAE